jgi:hypothetical protein
MTLRAEPKKLVGYWDAQNPDKRKYRPSPPQEEND